jgi:hypothetical protein
LNSAPKAGFFIRYLKAAKGAEVLNRIQEQAGDLSHRLEKLRGYL